MVGTIICEVGTIMCDIGTINVRFYLLKVRYPHGYCRITLIWHLLHTPKKQKKSSWLRQFEPFLLDNEIRLYLQFEACKKPKSSYLFPLNKLAIISHKN